MLLDLWSDNAEHHKESDSGLIIKDNAIKNNFSHQQNINDCATKDIFSHEYIQLVHFLKRDSSEIYDAKCLYRQYMKQNITSSSTLK